MTLFRRPLPLIAALLATGALAACASAPASGVQARVQRDRGIVSAGQGRSPYGLFLAGEAALAAGRVEEASSLFSRARAGAPDNEVIRGRAFVAALTAGEIERAARLAVGLTPSDGQSEGLGRLARAVDAMARNRGREAYEVLSAGEAQPPHGLAMEILKPWAAAAAGDFAAALAPAGPNPSTDAQITISPGEPSAQPTPRISAGQVADRMNQAGRLALLERAGRFGEADRLAGVLEGDAPLRLVLKHGAYLERRKRGPEAVALYERTLAREPSNTILAAALERARANRAPPPAAAINAGAAEALLIPASAFGAARQYETALAYARLAQHLDPRLDEAAVLTGDLLAAAGDIEGARRAYLQPRPGSDTYTGARARLALLLSENERDAEALEVIRAAAAAAPLDGSVLTTYAALLGDAGRKGEAADVFDPALATERGRRDWRLWYLRGSARERAGRWPEAERDLQEALRLAPEEPEVLNSLGYSWIDRGLRLKEALAMVEKAAALRPRSGTIVDSLGWAHYRLGNWSEAVVHLERAAELEPGDPTINDHLGDAYWRAGRRVEAQFQWTRALSLEPEPALKADVQAKLASTAGPDAVRPAAQAAAQP